MKKLILGLVSLVSCFGADLGVLYNDSNGNTISPNQLAISTFYINTNLQLKYITPNRVIINDSSSNIISSPLTGTQAGYLSALVGGTNLINLGLANLIGAAGNPTNGVMATNRTLYINTSSATINDTLWINLDTNWFRVASTNGGSINESQLNFSDVTTANATTSLHGLLPKLDGVATDFLNGAGGWANPLVSNLSGITNGYHLAASGGVGPGSTGVSQSALYETLGYLILKGQPFVPTEFQANSGYFTNQVRTADILVSNFTDVTTGNVTTNAHGLVPKADGNSSHFLNGLGQYSSPSGVGGGVAVTGSPVAGQVTYFSGTNSITGNAGFTYDGTTLNAQQFQGDVGVFNNLTVASTNGNVYSGTYIPTRVNISGATTAGTVDQLQHFTRIGNEVTVSGRLQMARTGSGILTFTVSLPTTTAAPISPTITGMAGQGIVIDTAGTFQIGTVIIYANSSTPDKAVFKSIGSSTSGTIREFWYSFTYTTN